MPARLWLMLALLLGAIGFGSCFALYVGVQEVRLHRAGPRRQVLAEDIRPDTTGWLVVLGCARHDLEVVIDSDGLVNPGERAAHDRIYFALVPQSECDEATPVAALHIQALVEAQDGTQQGLSRIYERGYVAPPIKVLVEGVIGYGGGDGRRLHLARKHFAELRLPQALQTAPLLVKDRRPGKPAIAYATGAVGIHGLLLLGLIGWLAVRRTLHGGLPAALRADELDEELGLSTPIDDDDDHDDDDGPPRTGRAGRAAIS